MAFGIVAAVILFALSRTRRRVFTGRVIIHIAKDHIPEPQISRNLIEYGRRTTLNQLTDGKTPALDAIIITPSPSAPSHLPQLQIKCKSPQIKFTKDFIEQNAAAGLNLSPGMEMTMHVETEAAQIRLVYIAV